MSHFRRVAIGAEAYRLLLEWDGPAGIVPDQLGRTVLSTEVRNGSVDISTLRTGIYFLALKSESKVSNVRVVKA